MPLAAACFVAAAKLELVYYTLALRGAWATCLALRRFVLVPRPLVLVSHALRSYLTLCASRASCSFLTLGSSVALGARASRVGASCSRLVQSAVCQSRASRAPMPV